MCQPNNVPHVRVNYIFEQRNSQDFWLAQKSRLTPCKNQIYRLEITSGK